MFEARTGLCADFNIARILRGTAERPQRLDGPIEIRRGDSCIVANRRRVAHAGFPDVIENALMLAETGETLADLHDRVFGWRLQRRGAHRRLMRIAETALEIQNVRQDREGEGIALRGFF